MNRLLAAFVILSMTFVAACGDDGGGDDGGGESGGAAPMPEECPTDTPFTVAFTGGEVLAGIESDEFEAVDAAAIALPITLDAGGATDLEDARAAAAETDLLGYTIYLSDTEIDPQSFGSILGLSAEEDQTLLSLSVIPPTETPIATGDTIEAGEPEFDSVTTFAAIGLQYQTGVTDDAPVLSTDAEGSGEVEVLFVDDEWICMHFTQEGDVMGDVDGEWSIDAVVAAPIEHRNELGYN